MPSCSPMTISFSGSSQDLVNKISLLINQHGGTISGGAAGGAFAISLSPFGTIKGTFSIVGQACTVIITERSFFLSCNAIQDFLQNNISRIEQAHPTEL